MKIRQAYKILNCHRRHNTRKIKTVFNAIDRCTTYVFRGGGDVNRLLIDSFTGGNRNES